MERASNLFFEQAAFELLAEYPAGDVYLRVLRSGSQTYRGDKKRKGSPSGQIGGSWGFLLG